MDEQLLLNLVRLRYRATPVWLEISSISTQFEASGAADVSGTLNEDVGQGGAQNPGSLGMGAGFGYSERPTISYTILGGESFIKRMLTPIPVTGIALLANSGWRGDRVLRMVVERINGVENAPQASGPTPALAPNTGEFQEAVGLIHRLRGVGLLTFEFAKHAKQISDPVSYENVEGDMLIDAAKSGLEFFVREDGKRMVLSQEQQTLMLRLADPATDSEDLRRLRTLLRLTPDGRRYDLVEQADGDYDPLDPGRALGKVSIDTRSLMGVLYYLSNAVRVPAEDMDAGPVTRTVDADGSPYDWAELLGGLFVVHYSKGRPSNAAVKVRYRGKWFYIADDDENSLSTFALLNHLASLTSGERRGPAPVLTLPVGG
jgi:hypothetical protein